MPTYDEVLERQNESTRQWVAAQSAAIVAQRGPAEPPRPTPPKPPAVDADARAHYDWWRTHIDHPLIANHLALALSKILDRLDALDER